MHLIIYTIRLQVLRTGAFWSSSISRTIFMKKKKTRKFTSITTFPLQNRFLWIVPSFLQVTANIFVITKCGCSGLVGRSWKEFVKYKKCSEGTLSFLICTLIWRWEKIWSGKVVWEIVMSCWEGLNLPLAFFVFRAYTCTCMYVYFFGTFYTCHETKEKYESYSFVAVYSLSM